MTRRHRRLAWAAAAASYCLIILGAVVRITGSGLGCGDHWPLCNGHVLPPLDLPTWIEWSHRLVAALVSILVIALAGSTAWIRSGRDKGVGSGEWAPPSKVSYVAFVLLLVQIVLGAVTVKLELPAWTVVLHLGTAMLLLAALLVATQPTPGSRPGSAGMIALGLAFITVLFGALTANLGAASACLGFPLCNGQLFPDGNYLQHVQWTHRLLAYGFAVYVAWWAWRVPGRGTRVVLGLVTLQVGVAAAMVLLALPRPLQALHVAVGAGVWAAVVLAAWCGR